MQGNGWKEMVPDHKYSDIVTGQLQNIKQNVKIITSPEWAIPITLSLKNNKMEDIWLAVNWIC